MFSKSRILAAFLTGLGIALIVGGLLAPRFVIGDGRLPLDVENTTWTITDPEGSVEGKTEPVTHQLHMDIQNPSNRHSASVRVGESLLAGTADNDFDNLVSAETWTFPLNRYTGDTTGPMELSTVMVLPDTEIAKPGPWLKLPSNMEQTTYDVFDPTLRETAPATFEDVEDIAGRTVYRFKQEIQPTNLALLYADMRNTSTKLDDDGNPIRLFLYYGATRDLLVDRVTGLVVGINESVDTYFADNDGKRVEDALSYNGTMAEGQTEAMLNGLNGVLSPDQSRRITWITVAVGVILAVIGLIGAFWPRHAR